MSFLAFEQLVLQLTPFLQSHVRYFVRAPIPIRKQVKLVIYRLACGHSCEKMNDLYRCGASTIHKYTDIGMFVQGSLVEFMMQDNFDGHLCTMNCTTGIFYQIQPSWLEVFK